MITFFYNIAIWLYRLIAYCISPFNIKAKQFSTGQTNILEKIRKALEGNNSPIIWFHAASLGEFEQGRPVMELLKQKHPEYKIFLTFFSPSGYEIRKNYAGADYIFYLPIDTKSNAKAFLKIVNPQKVYFIKYEFWYNYLTEIKRNNIPCYLISAIFRPNQVFFKWYGSWYRNILNSFTHIYVQNAASAQLLSSIGIKNYTVAGDTRFDRVADIVKQTKEIPIAKQFVANAKVCVAGSTWAADEDLITEYITTCSNEIKFIIAPHELGEAHLTDIESKIKNKSIIRYSAANSNNIDNVDVLIIDNIGMLSSLYKYGSIAYIGGGFGKGIHNTLEAATFGLPVVFGPNYLKFQEAIELIDNNAAHSINSYEELKEIFDNYFSDEQLLKTNGNNAAKYVKDNTGATNLII